MCFPFISLIDKITCDYPAMFVEIYGLINGLLVGFVKCELPIALLIDINFPVNWHNQVPWSQTIIINHEFACLFCLTSLLVEYEWLTTFMP